MTRVYNFAAGPAVLPEEVLKEAASEMLDYKGTGMSVMEMSHRSKAFEEIIQEAEEDLRELMNIPNNYKVLFLQGGASTQFAMVPMNLMKNRVADYIITGQWAKKAAAEAKKYGKVNELASSVDKTFSYIPELDKSKFSSDADYFYICYNNTALQTVEILDSVTWIRDYAFEGCNSLEYNEHNNAYYLGNETNPYLIYEPDGVANLSKSTFSFFCRMYDSRTDSICLSL